MGKIGWTELLVILIIVLIIFGGRRLPEIGSGLGQAIRNFRSSFKGPEGSDESSQKAGEQTKKSEQ
ncbi:MAG: twin-arginine translocase TatA/TatE family subunit [Syntrophobacterales bacterium]|nr:twin-arginine translocase TatA/TatE family subunit [Syntrophobacterales bacterium]